MIVGQIYKLTIPDDDRVYIGSTKGTLCLRKAIHKYMWKMKDHESRKTKGTCSSFQLLDKSNGECSLELIEKDTFENSTELRKRHKEILDNYEGQVVNQQAPYCSKEDRIMINRQLSKKNYYENHEAQKERRLKRYYAKKDIAKQEYMNWVEKNKDKVTAYKKQYIANKKICEECGGSYGCELDKHRRSLPHKKRMDKLQKD